MVGAVQVGGVPLSTMFPVPQRTAYALSHALWHFAPSLAKALGLVTTGHAKHVPLSKTLGYRFAFESEALGETLREMAVEQATLQINRTVNTEPDDGVRIVRFA